MCQKKKTTEELLEILKQSSSIDDYIDNADADMVHEELHEYLHRLLEEKGLNAGDLSKLAGQDRTNTYQILSGRKKPSRDKLLALCFGLDLSFEETQQLLKAAGYPFLYSRLHKDSVIIYALQHHISLLDVNEMLYDLSYEPL